MSERKQGQLIVNFWFEWFSYPGKESLVGNPHLYPEQSRRIFLDSPSKLIKHVQTRERLREPCYLSVQSFTERNIIYCIEKVYQDFDCITDLNKAWNEAYHYAKSLERFYGAKSLICFSGNKGYNAYTFLAEPVIIEDKNLGKRLYQKIVRKLFMGLPLYKTIDPAPATDISRLCRIPYTLHEKSQKFCTPVSGKNKPLLITSLEEYKKNGLSQEFIDTCWEEIYNEVKIRAFSQSKSWKRGKVRPCIEDALDLTLNQGQGHSMRLAIATEYLNHGYSVSQVVDLFRSQSDFNDAKTRHYVMDAKKKTYKPFRCATIEQLGFCIGKKCLIHEKKREKNE